MRASTPFVRFALVFGIGALCAAVPAFATETQITSLDDVVAIENVRSTDGEVTGTIANKTGDQLENIRLLVSDQFLWRNERHPGPDSPSNAYALTVPGPIPPRGSVRFRFERAASLPDRPDGRFDTEVSAIELVRRPPVAAAPATRVNEYEREERGYRTR